MKHYPSIDAVLVELMRTGKAAQPVAFVVVQEADLRQRGWTCMDRPRVYRQPEKAQAVLSGMSHGSHHTLVGSVLPRLATMSNIAQRAVSHLHITLLVSVKVPRY